MTNSNSIQQLRFILDQAEKQLGKTTKISSTQARKHLLELQKLSNTLRKDILAERKSKQIIKKKKPDVVETAKPEPEPVDEPSSPVKKKRVARKVKNSDELPEGPPKLVRQPRIE